MKKLTLKTFYILIFLVWSHILLAQQHFYPINNELNIRYEKAVYDQNSFFSDIKPFDNSHANVYDSINKNLHINASNGFLDHLLNKNALEKTNNRFSFDINPILTLLPQFQTGSNKVFSNYRFGLAIKGAIGKKFAFSINGAYGIKSFSDEIEQQAITNQSIPHFGRYFRNYDGNFNYIYLNGYLSYTPYKYLNINAGIGNNFWGEGYRSLFLSDHSAQYPYFKAILDVWKIKYVWHIGVLSDRNPDFADNHIRTKLLISHYLSYNATRWLNLNLFESVIANPYDSLGLVHFNPGYLNPVIFLRPLEFSGGSTDNAIMGVGFKIKLPKKCSLYGQFVVDEFVFSEMTSGDGWWGNKFGFQTGLKFFDLFGAKNLFARLEYNQVRPYTYSYYNPFGNYGNQYQPIAHPIGSNFMEWVFESHYHYQRLSAHVLFILSDAGVDIDPVSFGQDIYKSNNLRVSNYGISQNQGLSAEYTNINLKLSWLMNDKMNLSVFVSAQYQNYKTSFTHFQNKFLTFGITSLIGNEEPDFFKY